MTMKVLYVIYKMKSKTPFMVIYDCMPYRGRSLVMNKWNILGERNTNEEELLEFKKEEFVKRFKGFYYKDIDFLIKEDAIYGVETPPDVIDKMKRHIPIK